MGRWLVKPAVLPNSSLCLCWIGPHFKRLRELKHLLLPCLEQALNVFVEDPTIIISILPGEANVGQTKHWFFSTPFPCSEEWLDVNRTWLFPILELGQQCCALAELPGKLVLNTTAASAAEAPRQARRLPRGLKTLPATSCSHKCNL